MSQVDRIPWSSDVFPRGTVLMFALVCAWSASLLAHPAAAGAPPNVMVAHQPASQNPACAVLTVDEIRRITGFSGYRSPSPGDPPGQGAGGGASCQYEGTGPTVDERGNPVMLKGPLLSIVLIDGKDYTRTAAIGAGCRKEAAPGVGDLAYFEVCPTRMTSRTPPLYVKSGTKDLILQMDIETPETEASTRAKVIALGKAAAARMR